MFNAFQKEEKGFSLMELLLVMAILGIVASIAIPHYITYSRRAQIVRTQAELKSLADAIELLASDTGLHPTLNENIPIYPSPCIKMNDEIVLNSCKAGLLCTDGKYPNWHGPYVDDDMLVDPWGTPYWFDPDYRCKPSIRGCEGVPDGQDVRAVVSFGPNKLKLNQYDKDDVIRILCHPE